MLPCVASQPNRHLGRRRDRGGPRAARDPRARREPLPAATYWSNAGVKENGWPRIRHRGRPGRHTECLHHCLRALTTITDGRVDVAPIELRLPTEGNICPRTGWDVGSTAWTTSPFRRQGDDRYQAGSERLTDRRDRAPGSRSPRTWSEPTYYPDAMMEMVPTPAMTASTTSSITPMAGAPGRPHRPVPQRHARIGMVRSSATRSTEASTAGRSRRSATRSRRTAADRHLQRHRVAQGSNYTYKLGVRFEWTAHTPNYFEPNVPGPDTLTLVPGVPQPALLKYLGRCHQGRTPPDHRPELGRRRQPQRHRRHDGEPHQQLVGPERRLSRAVASAPARRSPVS
jgi:hypothetical protein